VRLAVFGRRRPAADATLGAVIATATARGHDAVVLDIADFISGPLCFWPEHGHLQLGDVDVDLASLDVMVLGPLPSAFARTAPGHVMLRSDEHDALQKAQAARHQLAWSIAHDVEARGVPVLSSPSRARHFDFKPLQVATLARAGVAVATTVITDHAHERSAADDDDDADDDDVITKPVVGGEVLVGARLTSGVPAIVQPRLRGTQLRLAVVGGRVVAVGAIDLDGDDAGDDAGNDAGVVDVRLSTQAWRHTPITAALAALGQRCALLCAFDVCAVDVIATADGPVVLDVNRTPQLMDLAAACDVDVAAAIVDLLERRARPG
jgi:glutathione synthase/RimK-type ligase-like ATP-grasp enzyme